MKPQITCKSMNEAFTESRDRVNRIFEKTSFLLTFIEAFDELAYSINDLSCESLWSLDNFRLSTGYNKCHVH